MARHAPTTLLTGLGLVESPRWHGDRLYFSDWSAGEVIAIGLGGASEVVARVDSLPLCTAWHPDGRLILVSSREGRLLRREADGSLVTHADLAAVTARDGTTSSWTVAATPTSTAAASTPPGGEFAPGGVVSSRQRRDHGGRRRRGLPQRDGRHAPTAAR